MGILQDLEELQNKIAVMEGWKGHLDKMEAKEWEEKYWITVRSLIEVQKNLSEKISAFAHEVFRARNLQNENLLQASKIQQLELLLSYIHRVGEGLHINHTGMQRIYHLYPDLKQFIHERHEPQGLSSSKYVRK